MNHKKKPTEHFHYFLFQILQPGSVFELGFDPLPKKNRVGKILKTFITKNKTRK